MSSETELNDSFIEVSVEYHYPPIVLSSHLLLASIHGESLGEHEIYFCHAGSFRQVTLVPLVIAGPGIPKGETDRLVTTLDLYPTILEVASLKPGSMQEGKSLFTILRRDRADPHDIVFMEAVDGVFKGIFTP